MPILPTGRALLDAPALLAKAGLSAGMRYADFGAGSLGHFACPAAEIVGAEGRAYAVDILKRALSGVEGRCRHEGLNNLVTVWGDFEAPGGVHIPAGSLDLVSFVNDGLALKRGAVPLREAARALKPSGRVLIADWKRDAPAGLAPEERVVPEELMDSVAAAGFAVAESFEAGEHHWGLLLRRA